MSIPIRIQLFDAFLGEQDSVHSLLLPDVFSSGGSQNLWIDKYGRAKKILGYAALNATKVTTDTGSSATMVRDLFRFRSSASGAFTRRLLGCFDDQTNEFEIWASTDDGLTWSFVQDLGAGSINSNPDFAQLGNTLIFTNGVVAPRTYDGTTWGTAGGSQAISDLAAAEGASGNLTGHYQWKIVPIDGSTSPNSRKIASVTSNELTSQSKQAAMTWTADPDVNVVGYELYRTTGTGAVFYFAAFIDGRTTASYTDNLPDLQLLENRVLEEHGDAPPTGSYFCETHKQRMWYLRTDTYPRRAWWSDPGDPDSVWSENYIEFSDAETMGDVITGAFGDFEGHLVVGTERAIWTISGTGTIIGNLVDWSRTKTNAQIGWVTKRTVARIPAGAKFVDQTGQVKTTDSVTLAYMTPLGDIRLFDGDNDVIISHPKKDLLETLAYSARSRAFCVPDIERNEITWLFPTGSSTEPDTAITWNYRWGVWYERGWAFSSGVAIEAASDAHVLLAGSNSTTTGGQVYTLWSGSSFAGTDIEAIWMTKTLYGTNDAGQPALSHTKRWRWVDFLFETEATATLTLEWLPGNSPDNAAASGSVTFAPTFYSILTAGGDTIITAGGDTIVLSSASSLKRVRLQSSGGDWLHDEGIRLRVGDNASLGSWALEGMSLAYQILPGLRRRFQS